MTRKLSVSPNKPAKTRARVVAFPADNAAAVAGGNADSGCHAGGEPVAPFTPTEVAQVVEAAKLVSAPQAETETADTADGGCVLIEIDPVISGSHVYGRFDVMIRGRTVSPAVIDEIRLQVDGRVTSTATFGQPERAASAFMPDGRPAGQRAFRFNLPRPGHGRAERCVFQVIARCEDGFEYAEAFEIEIDPTSEDRVSIVSGTTHSAPSAARPHAIMYIERGTIDPEGVLSVQGWAVSLGSILAVQVFAGHERISKANIAEQRNDVAAAFPAYPNAHLSGFSLTLQLEGIDRNSECLRAQVVCPDGFGHEESIPVERLQCRLGGRPHPTGEPALFDTLSQQDLSLLHQKSAYQRQTELRIDNDSMLGLALATAPPRRRSSAKLARVAVAALPKANEPAAEIKMYCDSAELTGDGTLSLSGWAVCGVGIVQVCVLLDNEKVGLASCGHDRPDVGSSFPDIPMAHLSGFQFERRIGQRFEGEHNVRVIVRTIVDTGAERQLTVTATKVAIPGPSRIPELGQAREELEITPEQAGEFRFELDAPTVSNGAAVALVTGRLTIDGWLLTRSGVASFEVFLDDQRLGDVHYRLARQDVGAAFPDWPNALRSGYAFHCPPRSLRDGDHEVRLQIRSNNGLEIARAFRITVRKTDDQQDFSSIRRRIPRVEADMMAAILADLNFFPTFQFILRQDDLVNADRVGATLDALRAQAYLDWTVLVLAQNDNVVTEMQIIIDASVPRLANRFTLISPSNFEAWNGSLGRRDEGRPSLYLVLLPGDEPGADALLELAVASGRQPNHDMLYGDEVRISPVSQEKEPFFKPDFSVDLLLSTNYIGRLWAVTAALLADAGATPASLVTDGEYDLVLRCVELAAGVHHIPKLLCQRFARDLDHPEQEQAALQRMLGRRGMVADILETPVAGTWRIKRAVPSKGKVSIIISTCAAHGYIETCISTLRAKTAYRDFEIICIDNIPDSEATWKDWVQRNADKVVKIPDAFNWSIFNNRAVEVAEGEFLLFLNDDIEIFQEDWLDAMMEHVRRPEVGITGPRMLYRDGTVQHAGMFLSSNGTGRHAFRFAAKDDPCYFGLALTQRNVMAVTGACMLVRSETFERVGRFNEAHEIVNNDLDFCLHVHRAGLLTVFTPYATLIHHELGSRANIRDVFDLAHFNAAWKTTFAAGDPYFNPRLSRHADDYQPDDEPVQWVVSGAPMFHPAEIQRILVVKLDHIGDFVTALPPIRRLKKLFPHALLTVLAGPDLGAFISLEPSIDEFIPFAFFHARSQLGERTLTTEDYTRLAEQLRPYRFDLAVDLRKHLSTRDVLKYTGARFLAGFDYLGQFPFLDIALDWDGDRTLQRKRSHVVDDLMALVNAIGHASEADRVIMQPGPDAMPLILLPDEVRTLFAKPVVAIHAGAGNITKQWPEEHFSSLIDLLVERNAVNIVLIGGPDEIAVANKLLKSVLQSNAVASMAGKTSLADLPRLLKNCALYIGNDSGPKHIAAAVGIPTIGIHSGVVDPVEWGPIGPNAVALRRNMTCSPCYLAKAEDCPRSLACLRFFEPAQVYETADLLLTRIRPVPVALTERAATACQEKPPLQEIMSDMTVSMELGASAAAKPVRKPKVKRSQRRTEAA